MWKIILFCYVAANLALGLRFHRSARSMDDHRPRFPEVIVYFLVMSILGIPIFLLFHATHRRGIFRS